MFSPYEFGYSWTVTYGHLVPLAIFAAIGAAAIWRRWPRWVSALSGAVCVWALFGLFVMHLVIRISQPVEPPVARFLASGAGRVLDAGAGSGRAAIGVLLTRPKATIVGLDIYSGYWGIDDNTPERFLANARIAGAADRADVRTGDMREMPFEDGEFDAVVSVAAIDHLRGDGIVKALAEVARVLKPRGEFLLTIVNADWIATLASPLAIGHHPRQHPDAWRARLEQAGFAIEEEGTQVGARYFYAIMGAAQVR